MRITTPNLPFYCAAHSKTGPGAAEFAFPGPESLVFPPVRSAVIPAALQSSFFSTLCDDITKNNCTVFIKYLII